MVNSLRSNSLFSVLRGSNRHASLSSASGLARSQSITLPIIPAANDESTMTRTCRLGFFDLPAEIRNEIYAFVVCDAVLTLPSATVSTSWRVRRGLKRTKSAPMPINGLLLASRQSRQEYMAVLLSTVQVHVEVKDFDFDSLMRVSTRFNALERQALRCNPRLVILLSTQNCTAKDLLALRRWLEFRHTQPHTLNWTYKFPLDRLLPPSTIGRVRLLRELEYYADTIATLEVDLPAPQQQAELKRIVEAFETEIRQLDGDIGWLGQYTTRAARNVRGLMGGGLR